LAASPGRIFQNLRQRIVLSEQLGDVATDTVGRDTRCGVGADPPLRWLGGHEGTYARLVISARVRTSPVLSDCRPQGRHAL